MSLPGGDVVKASGRFDFPDCRDAAAYADTLRLTRLGWAWEFLRRNARFREDLSVVLDTAVQLDDRPAALTVTTMPIKPEWDVLFR